MIFVFSSLTVIGLFDFERISTGIPAVLKLLPDDYNFFRAGTWFKPLIDSLAMSFRNFDFCFFIFTSMFFCCNSTINPIVYNLATLILNVTRAVPELILGIILVAMIGFGALPGTLALGLHSVGMLGKFYAEAIELCDKEPIEAARASGASDLQVIVHSILPQVFPAMADVTFYRWEYNFRASMVVGAVGAGGIGLEIISALRIMDYAQVSALLIVVLVVVTVLDSMSNYLRKSVSE